jgi:hypothetical protein
MNQQEFHYGTVGFPLMILKGSITALHA